MGEVSTGTMMMVAWWPTFSEPRLVLSDGTLYNLKVMIVIVRLALE